MNKLLGYKKNHSEINSIAKSIISVSELDKKIVQKINLPRNFIAVALGGEWSYRTYQKWNKVIEEIIEDNNEINIVLLGSSNANYFAKKILDKLAHRNIYNCVNKYTFNQTAQIINKAQILLCCDGGLMHAANSVDTPIVALFAKLSPEMQLTETIKAFSVYDESDVNNIMVENILKKYLEASSLFCNRPQAE